MQKIDRKILSNAAVKFIRLIKKVEVTAMQQLTAKSCKSLQAATQFSLL
jgi:hypothetical protein